MNAGIIVIGDELLLGQVLDTNSAWLGMELSKLGVKVARKITCADEEKEILHALDEAASVSDLVVITGGLGPTTDDITKISLCKYFGSRLIRNEEIYGIVKAGLNRMATSMAVDLAGTGITSNCIAPGYIDSRVLPASQENNRGGKGYADHAIPSIPMRRGGVPRDIANMALFLASDLSSYVNGETILVDGGLLSGGTPD